MATDLDQLVEEFRHRPPDQTGPFTFVAADALTMKVREGGRVINAVVGAEYGQPTAGRLAQRNGYRHRPLDTRVGTLDVAVPKLRKGTYFPEWLLERRKRAESALITVVADCYLAGVSTRRMAPPLHASR